MSGERLRVGVDVATMWTSPEAPRDIDAAAVADVPDVAGWLDGLTLEDRLGLHDRTLTQLLRDEPVELIDEAGDWVRVVAPWQPDKSDDRGYPGWVRRAHLRESVETDPEQPVAVPGVDRISIMESGRDHLGLPYLWGGTSPAGLDCSGLVHHSYRRAGVVVPRDADVQQAAAAPIAIGEEQPGDLYFFGDPETRTITHVGFVTGEQQMLHAPEDTTEPGAGVIEDVPLSESLATRLLHVGRFLD